MTYDSDDEETAGCSPVCLKRRRRGAGCTPGKFSFIWLATWVLDWSIVLLAFPVIQWWFTVQEFTDPWGFVQLFCLVSVLAVVLIGRDEMMMVVLGDLVSEYKTDDGVPRSLYATLEGPAKLTLYFTIPVFIAGPSSPIAMFRGLLDWHYDILSLEGVMRMWCEWFVFYTWKDIFSFALIHRAMHQNWFGLYRIHKEHHRGKRNLNIFNATTIDFFDNFLESAGIAFINIPVMWALGWPLTMHMGSMCLTAIADIQVHSVNPYTVTWYNPIMDWIFLGNVQHNLHHAKGRDHYTVVPWHHIVPAWRSADIEDYNRIMYTAWDF